MRTASSVTMISIDDDDERTEVGGAAEVDILDSKMEGFYCMTTKNVV